MILVDTSVWVDHLRKEDPELSPLLANKQVLIHPFVIGEILIGSVRHRDRLESRLNALIQTKIVSDMEVNFFVRTHEIFGRGCLLDDTRQTSSRCRDGIRVSLTSNPNIYQSPQLMLQICSHSSVSRRAADLLELARNK